MATETTSLFKAPDFKSFFLNSGILKEGTQIDFFVSPKLLWTSAGVVFLFFVIISLILIYHWVTYGYKPSVVGLAMIIYLGGSFVVFSVILITLLSYSASI